MSKNKIIRKPIKLQRRIERQSKQQQVMAWLQQRAA